VWRDRASSQPGAIDIGRNAPDSRTSGTIAVLMTGANTSGFMTSAIALDSAAKLTPSRIISSSATSTPLSMTNRRSASASASSR
jgi:hypothetical protein